MRWPLRFPRQSTSFLLSGLALALGGCGDKESSPVPTPLAVQAQIVTASQKIQSVALTGEIKARVQSDLAFRVTGRLTERFVEIGDHVEAGQMLAKLEPQEQEADVASATAGVQSAEATLRQTTAAFDRQQTLLANGFTTQGNYDNALQALQAARATLDAVRSNLGTAREQLAYTTLTASASGIVVSRSAEAGQVVDAAQSVFTVARDGERDAVFEVNEGLLSHRPADGSIEVALVSDPTVIAIGHIREVAPAVDPSTGTVRVKFSIDAPPAAMTLGTAVTGTGRFQPGKVFALPSSAFFTQNGNPAVWTVDPQTHVATIKPISVDSYRTDEILVADGLQSGDVVVTAGTQLLHPGQTVTPLMPVGQVNGEASK
ncbi:efflux RND transporter periplasmic adaptor subunit [Labrys sp. 22185]|uniref:efflux RND transporter periplasmic adaptor subunit n=1 Tax=Labrys sp. 22185 TaxID=3453888 RepID=UPI003F87B71E